MFGIDGNKGISVGLRLLRDKRGRNHEGCEGLRSQVNRIDFSISRVFECCSGDADAWPR